jgi:hypothetical protein
MATPSSREQLKDYCLRRLGFPVIDINVDDDQLDDRIDDAIQLYQDYHYCGTENVYLATQVTAGDIANSSFKLADSISGVSRVLPISSSQSSSIGGDFNIFDINYQIRLNDFYNLTASSYTYYVIAREHLEMLNQIITGEVPFEFNKKTHNLRIYFDWSARTDLNSYVVLECTRIVDPDAYSSVYNDSWLKKYTTQLFKRQWGENLKKYGNFTLPGGMVINGDAIWNESSLEIEKLEADLRDTYEAPPRFIVG